MTWARICSVRGALARRNLPYVSITRIATHGLEGCDQQSSESMRCQPLWKRYASGFEGGGSDDSRNNNGGSGDSEEKGQWRQWVEQRLKAKEAGQSASISQEERGFRFRGLAIQDETPGSVASMQDSTTDVHSRVEPMDEFESRVLGLSSKKDGAEDDDLLRELEEIEQSALWRASGTSEEEVEEGETEEEEMDTDSDEDEEWDNEGGQVLSDTALSAIVDYDLDDEERPYQFRPDRLFFPGQTYEPEDLDLSKTPEEREKPPPRYRRIYESHEVLLRADFRNPRYLSNFIAETSRILPRRRSRLSAKAQRKIVREIKTARVLGLMPFTSMGQAPFRFMRSRLDDNGAPQGSEY
ncbi:unnamed protein product [Sphagnum compactum]